MSNLEKSYSKSDLGNIIADAVMITILVMAAFTAIIVSHVISTARDYQMKMIDGFVPEIQLTRDETIFLEQVKAEWAMGNQAPMMTWIEELRAKGKCGILPPLPEPDSRISFWGVSDVIYVNRTRKYVLLPRNHDTAPRSP